LDRLAKQPIKSSDLRNETGWSDVMMLHYLIQFVRRTSMKKDARVESFSFYLIGTIERLLNVLCENIH
jgi:hypothetical protein